MVVAPYVSKKIISLITIEQEVALGDKMYESIEPYLQIDEEKSEKLNNFFYSLHFQTEYPVKVFYSDSEEINAFAVPGGKIIVHKGLINQLDSWQELAALLSHELAHVTKRHSLKTLSKNLSSYFIISIITSDFSGVSSVFIDNAIKLENLSNSRSFEQEADEIGFQYLIKSHINPDGMLQLFNILQNTDKIIINKNVKKIVKILSTHPLTEDRINNIKQMIEQLQDTVYEKNKKAQHIFNQIK
jgi:predicted Zn-dependent protease